LIITTNNIVFVIHWYANLIIDHQVYHM